MDISIKAKGAVLTGPHRGYPFQCIYVPGPDEYPCIVVNDEVVVAECMELHLQPSSFLPGSLDQNWLRFILKRDDVARYGGAPRESVLCVMSDAEITTPHTAFTYHDTEEGHLMSIDGYRLTGIEEIVVTIENGETRVSTRYVFNGGKNDQA